MNEACSCGSLPANHVPNGIHCRGVAITEAPPKDPIFAIPPNLPAWPVNLPVWPVPPTTTALPGRILSALVTLFGLPPPPTPAHENWHYKKIDQMIQNPGHYMEFGSPVMPRFFVFSFGNLMEFGLDPAQQNIIHCACCAIGTAPIRAKLLKEHHVA